MTGHVETALLFEASLKAQVLIVCVKFEGFTALNKLYILIKEYTITSEMSVHRLHGVVSQRQYVLLRVLLLRVILTGR